MKNKNKQQKTKKHHDTILSRSEKYNQVKSSLSFLLEIPTKNNSKHKKHERRKET